MSDERSPHSEREIEGLRKLRVYGGNAVLGEQEANELVDAYDALVEQLEATEQRLAREISEHADREQALRQLQFLAVNGQNRHSDSLEALREIESRAREALNPANLRESGRGGSKETDAQDGARGASPPSDTGSESVVRVHAPASDTSSPASELEDA